ncbi:2,5-diamino-6-(ribosylamino)-4(3H)-pyrimidinone 5'-phosphate reductase [Ceratobasidium sp. 414]|nr:2,5-diamino-6-(ribosylamino)-4(3H)-pyrimidinone 5'-phosphate reductase [Ceratobasidium sp. 414]
MSSSSCPPEFLKSVISARDAAPRSSEQQKRARVTLTYAQSLDAKIAGAGGRQLTISGNESMTMTHWLRTMHQGIMVGIQTVLNDDPQLNVRRLPPRDPPYPQPRPIILDSYLRTPPTCKLLTNFAAGTGLAPYIIYGLPLFDMEESKELRRRKKALEEAGAVLVTGFEVDGESTLRYIQPNRLTMRCLGRLDLAGALRLLKMRGINSVMIEGGQRVISSMLTDRHADGSVLVDTLIVTVAPTLIGSDGMGVIQQGKKVCYPSIHQGKR